MSHHLRSLSSVAVNCNTPETTAVGSPSMVSVGPSKMNLPTLAPYAYTRSCSATRDRLIAFWAFCSARETTLDITIIIVGKIDRSCTNSSCNRGT